MGAVSAWGALLVGALSALGCGGGPHYVRSPAPLPPDPVEVVAPAPEPTAIYIIVNQPEGTAAPEIVTQDESGWIPREFPAENPFQRSRTWVGDYDCVQGNTGLALRIVDVRGRVVRAVFDFQHAPSGATGSYLIAGTYEPETRRVRFDPSRWIVQPEDYVMVSMEGEIATDGSLFAGKITFPGCGAFHLKPTR
ncbi:hypothetical protein [Polyangium jinanense]|uniref:Lipoprotein n=1 Tax=Polyangium jinanense TaxID=2829994 RepID=A0A9X3XBF8_9BACT|nr:hypothetical protein [Polyangium jinanense]MDC3957554.1 hypothetical protein [Polyangium jinanense]MDC3984956.1 hypothetical protein [Polyangium jinanense]